MRCGFYILDVFLIFKVALKGGTNFVRVPMIDKFINLTHIDHAGKIIGKYKCINEQDNLNFS